MPPKGSPSGRAAQSDAKAGERASYESQIKISNQGHAGSLSRYATAPSRREPGERVFSHERPPPGGGWHAKRDWGRVRAYNIALFLPFHSMFLSENSITWFSNLHRKSGRRNASLPRSTLASSLAFPWGKVARVAVTDEGHTRVPDLLQKNVEMTSRECRFLKKIWYTGCTTFEVV